MSVLVAMALVAMCVAVRLVVDAGALPYNFAAIASAALFAGYIMRSRKLALAVPVVALVISNAMLGGYDWVVMMFVFAALVLPVAIGRWIDRRGTRGVALAAWLGVSAFASSVVFFAMTNGAVWAFTPWYETTLSGLARCYIAGLPFFKWTLASNMVFTTAFFGAAALVPMLQSNMRPVELPAR